MAPKSIVVVGSGHAGIRAAETLHREGWPGDVVLIGDETHRPYDRAAVSKGMLFADAEPICLTDADIDMRLGLRIAGIDRDGRRLHIADGTSIAYDHLILATGARPRLLGLGEAGLPGVHTLRRATDALALRPLLRRGARLVVIGGGLIGLEIAAGAKRAGLAVTVIETQPRLMTRVLPEPVSARLADEHRGAGVTIRTGESVAAIARSNECLAIQLGSGERLEADLVVVAIGVVPNIELAVDAGLPIANGLVVDAALLTVDPAISAIGDMANAMHPLFGTPIRFESQQIAEDHGRHVAHRLMGGEALFRGVPWSWSDQYDKVAQVAGVPALGTQLVQRHFDDEAIMCCHLDADGVLLGATAFGQPGRVAQEIGAARRLVARSARLDAAQLGNVGRPLRSWL